MEQDAAPPGNGLTGLLAEQFAGTHGAYNGTHTHEHDANDSQGSDAQHSHSHSHDGNGDHGHRHGASLAPETLARLRHPTFRRPPTETESVVAMAAYRALGFDQDGFTASAGLDPMLGANWAVWGTDDPAPGVERGYVIIHRESLTAAAVQWGTAPAASYGEALGVLAEQLAQGDPRQVLDQGWRSEMAFEGVPTGDGRFIDPGAIQFRPTPLPLMLQTTTESGHMGAVLAGSINQTGMLGQTAVGVGDFDATDAGKQMNQIIGARGKFGVSIDVAEAEGQPVCDQHGEPSYETCDEDCDITMHFSLCRIMGLTATPFPAFQDAYIEMQTQPASTAVAASGEFVAVDEDAPARHQVSLTVTANGQPYVFGGGANNGTSSIDVSRMVDAVFAQTSTSTSLASLVAAAAAPAISLPPAAWLENPAFSDDDPRMYRQWATTDINEPTGPLACPTTIEPVDPATGLRRVYGHLAPWNMCHTGITSHCETPPKSSTAYAAFHLGGVETAEGELVRVGHITMGTGHAATTGREQIRNVQAHYDGGPGAVRVATVRVGEDKFGIWFAGYIEPDATDSQIRTFQATTVSGDWRKVWSGKGRELVAVLGGVTVPGFPVTALAASGAAGGDLEMDLLCEMSNDPLEAFDHGEAVVLVASGLIRPPLPWERSQADMAHRIVELESALDLVTKITAPLKTLAAERLQAQVFAAPTAVDKIMPGLLAKAMLDVHAGIVEQSKDPDAASDPVDKKIAAALQAVASNLLEAIRLQGEDGADDDGPPQDATAASAVEAAV